MDPQTFDAPSLRRHPLGTAVARVLSEALAAVDPERLIRETVRWTPSGLRIRDETIPLGEGGRILVVGAGKAGLAMARALVDVLGDRIDDGVMAVKAPAGSPGRALGSIHIVPSGHPIPDDRSIDAGRRLIDLARAAGPQDIVLCPISGGASSLVTLPREGLRLQDLRTITQALLEGGAAIGELNAVRKHLDALKGGGLALAAAPARVAALVISDVVGDPLDVIASGPTIGDRSTFDDAWGTLVRIMGAEEIPEGIRRHLQAGRAGLRPEPPRPDDPRLARVHHVVLAGNGTAVEAAVAAAGAQGLRVLGRHALAGEARGCGEALAARLSELRGDTAACIVAGGETTVTVAGDGRGGRNLEVALGSVETLAGASGALLVSLATDGEDGPTDAAGAVVTGSTLARAQAQRLDLRAHLARNDSLSFFDALGDTIRTGPTGTNVCDLALLSWTPPEPASS